MLREKRLTLRAFRRLLFLTCVWTLMRAWVRLGARCGRGRDARC